MDQVMTGKYIMAALVYSLLGLIILGFSFMIFDKLTPGHLWKEIILEKNLPLAVVAAAFILAIAHIIASAIHS